MCKYKLSILFLLLVIVFTASSQNYNVTLQVDMSAEATVAGTISVAGNFQVVAGYPTDWTPGTTILTDANSDLVYEITLSLPAGSYEYKFLNGTQWGTDESVPGVCQVNGNRGLTVTGDKVLDVVCFGECSSCPVQVDTITVTFQVDLNNETANDTISVVGDFASNVIGQTLSDWIPGTIIMTDGNNDGIYDITLDILEGTYEYKYVNGTVWGQEETIPSTCSVNNNRQLIVESPSPITLPVVCFSGCSSCQPLLPPVNVTFRVEMSDEIVNTNGIYVSGSFMDPIWVKDSLLMTDVDSDGIYEYTYSVVPGIYTYKFYNGDCGDACAETANFLLGGCGVSNGVGGWSREFDISGRLSDTILPIYKYNTCDALGGDTTSSRVLSIEERVVVLQDPAKGIVQIIGLDKLKDISDLALYDMNGQMVLLLNSGNTIHNLSHLQSGIYLLHIAAYNQRSTTKILVY